MTPISPAHKSYLKKLRHERIIIRLTQIFIFILFFIIWELAVRLDWIDGFIFSSPSRVWNTFFSMAKDGSIFYHICITLSETIGSFLLVVSIGTITAILLWLSERLSKIIEPYLIKQPSKICSCSSFDCMARNWNKNDYCNWYFNCRLRNCFKLIYRLSRNVL